jgi:5-methylcytosine-specific restriction endonuclease McrA
MTGRTVTEWVGSSPDAAIPKTVKARIWRRQEGKCAISGVKVPTGEGDFDHIKPLSMGGQHAEANLQLVWRPVHREKTAEEATGRAKADRIFLKANGLWPKSKRPLQSRGFDRSRPESDR